MNNLSKHSDQKSESLKKRETECEALVSPTLTYSLFCLLETEAQCKKALMDWLLKYDKQMYYDRLTRALQYVGRTDIAIGETQMKMVKILIWCSTE